MFKFISCLIKLECFKQTRINKCEEKRNTTEVWCCGNTDNSIFTLDFWVVRFNRQEIRTVSGSCSEIIPNWQFLSFLPLTLACHSALHWIWSRILINIWLTPSLGAHPAVGAQFKWFKWFVTFFQRNLPNLCCTSVMQTWVSCATLVID